MRRADRLFQIIQLLRTRRITTASWLAEALEVSERTVYRDIRDLMCSGVPIDGEAGVGYILRRGFDLPPLMFNAEEISALTLGARIVQSWADANLARAAGQVLSKVETVLPEALKSRLDETHLYAPLTQIRPQVAEAMGRLRAATDGRRTATFAYRRADGTESRRTVWPLGLFFWGATWTLGAWCELRDDFRNFRLDRLSALTVNDEHYADTPGRRLADMIAAEKRRMAQWQQQ